jgi:hypothetical protein
LDGSLLYLPSKILLFGVHEKNMKKLNTRTRAFADLFSPPPLTVNSSLSRELFPYIPDPLPIDVDDFAAECLELKENKALDPARHAEIQEKIDDRRLNRYGLDVLIYEEVKKHFLSGRRIIDDGTEIW